MTVSTPAATSAPASVPRNAGIRASPLATAEVRINDSVASSTQNPWERSSRSAARRAAARPSASRTAFWKYTERGVKWAASLRHHSSAVGMSRYQADRRRIGGRVGWRARGGTHGEDHADGGVADRGGEAADPRDRRQLVAGEPARDPFDPAFEVVRDARDERPALGRWPLGAQGRRAPGERVADRGAHGRGRGLRDRVVQVGEESREQPSPHQQRAQLRGGVGERPVAAAGAGRPDRRGQPARAQRPHGGLGRLPRAVGGQAGDVVGDGVDGVGEPGAERLRRTRGPQQPVGGRDEPDADREPDEPLGQ